jgi:hypothetical protein
LSLRRLESFNGPQLPNPLSHALIRFKIPHMWLVLQLGSYNYESLPLRGHLWLAGVLKF